MVQFTHFGASHLKDSMGFGKLSKKLDITRTSNAKKVLCPTKMFTLTLVPQECREFFLFQLSSNQDHGNSEGSVEETQVNIADLLLYKENQICAISSIQASKLNVHDITSRRSQKFFTQVEVSWLTQVYKELYPSSQIGHVPMAYKQFKRLTVFGKTMLSCSARGNVIILLLYLLIGLALKEVYHLVN